MVNLLAIISKEVDMKKQNEYQRMLSQEFFNKTPKAVFAALAVSFVYNHKEFSKETIEDYLKAEWELLHTQGIVPQKPKN